MLPEDDSNVSTAPTAAPGSSSEVGLVLTAPATDPLLAGSLARGALLGRYVVLAPLGAGGMSLVYIAYDPELDRKVAIKVLRPGGSGTAWQARLVREAHALARLSHAHVIAVYDVGTVGEAVFLVEELLDGGTLEGWLAAAPRSWREVLAMFGRAGRGLAAAHAAGLVHRDFKPANVLLGVDGRVRVTDFGLVRPVGESKRSPAPAPAELADEPSARTPVDTTLTHTGAVLGTPAYMAPEQHRGEAADERADQFGFCVALYEALYGERPFAGATRGELADAVQAHAVRPAAPGNRVPGWVRRIVVRGLSTAPAARHPSMEALLAELAHDPAVARRRWALGAGLAVLLAAGIGAGYRLRARPQCGGAEQQLVGVWDDERRAAVRAALVGVPYAEEAGRGAAQALDAWAAEFTAAHREACEATRVRGEQSELLLDRRMSCLARRRQEAAALIGLLARADAQTVEHAVDAARGLTPIATCADEAAVMTAIALPDAAIAPAVAALQRTIDESAALDDLGKYGEGLALALLAAATADALGYQPARAEAYLQLGILAQAIDLPALAESALLEAVWAGEGAHADRVVASARVLLVRVMGNLDRFADGHRAHREAQAVLTRLGDPMHLQGNLDSYVAGILAAEGKYAEARGYFERTLAAREATYGADDLSVAVARYDLALMSMKEGQYDVGEAQLRQLLPRFQQVLGAAHPRTGDVLHALGQALQLQGRHEEAVEEFGRAAALREAAFGPDHPDVATSLTQRALSLARLGRTDEAMAAYQRALAILLAARGEDDLEVARARGNLAGLYGQLGRHGDAAALLEQVLASQQRRLPAEHPEIGTTHDNLAFSLSSQGRHAEALAHGERALDIKEEALGPEHPSVGNAHANLGAVHRALGRYREAETHFQQALANWTAAYGPDHPRLAEPLTGLGRVALDTGAAARAVPLLERALALRAGAGDTAERAETAFALAEALWPSPSQRPRARDLARQARDAYTAAGPGRAADTAATAAWLSRH